MRADTSVMVWRALDEKHKCARVCRYARLCVRADICALMLIYGLALECMRACVCIGTRSITKTKHQNILLAGRRTVEQMLSRRLRAI